MLLTMARLITAGLIIASAAAFAAGTTIERHTASSESQVTQQGQRHHPEASGPGDNSVGAESAPSAEGSNTHATEHNPEHAAEHNPETLLGINPEATWLVVIAVAISLVLAALILTVRSALPAAVIALAMLAFTALDIRELTHQLNESHPGLAALAATVALLHLAAGTAALLATRDTRSQHRVSTA